MIFVLFEDQSHLLQCYFFQPLKIVSISSSIRNNLAQVPRMWNFENRFGQFGPASSGNPFEVLLVISDFIFLQIECFQFFPITFRNDGNRFFIDIAIFYIKTLKYIISTAKVMAILIIVSL